MSNFTLQDVAGSAVAAAVFALALYVPGYVLGYAADLFEFRRGSFRDRMPWAIAYSFAVTPLAGYLVAKYAGLDTACWSLLGLALVWLALAWRDRRGFAWSSSDTLTACVAGAWVCLVILSLVDLQVGHRLYFSVVEDDQSYRVAFTNAVMRTGVPPANPLYFPGHGQPMRYYYFWYVVCALVARIGHVSARQAFVASSVWAGFGMAAVLALYVRHFLDAGNEARRRTWIAVALLMVTGADLLPAVGGIVAGTPLNGDMEWWSNDQISSWADSLLWVPHHVASLLCCLVAFLLLWMCRNATDTRSRAGACLVAALAFASAFGLSIYVAFGFALLMLAWMVRLLFGRPRNRALALCVAASGIAGAVFLAPYLHEMIGNPSGSDTSASIAPSHVFALSIRRMIDPGFLTGLPVFVAWNRAHPVLLDQAARLILLLPGVALELGFFGAVLWIYARHRKNYAADGPQRTALYLAGCGMVLALFVRSSVIGNNDFGYRVAMLPQFFLLLLGVDLVASWRSKEGSAKIPPARWHRKVLYGLLAVGVGGTVYQVVMLRVFLPLEASRAGSRFAELPTEVFQGREAFAELERVSSSSAVVEFNPADPHPVSGDDVIPPNAFYARSLLMNANRQVLTAEPRCAIEFGGDWQSCQEIANTTARLYTLPAPSAQWAQEYCRQFGTDYLAVAQMDPVWGDAAGWGATLPAVVSEPGFRIVQCSAEAGPR